MAEHGEKKMGRSPRLKLADGLERVAVAELGEEIRRRLGDDPGEFVLALPGSRSWSCGVDAETAALLEEFRQPSTIPEAIVRFSRKRDLDPELTLEARYPQLMNLLSGRFLRLADGEREARPSGRSFFPGETFNGATVVRLLRFMEDTELYLLGLDNGRFAVLKIERPNARQEVGCLRHEEEVLRALEGDPAPELLAAGNYEGRDYLLMEWFPGSHAKVAAEEWQRRPEAGSRQHLLDLCRAITAAYARLHARGVLHGDVHASNVLVDRKGQVKLVDFALARLLESGKGHETVPRAGVPLYWEPECASALLESQIPPPVTEAGEQYALAALIYELLTGWTYLDIQLMKDLMLRQIVSDPPLAFVDRGVQAWPAVEAILKRALAKEPSQRFGSVAELVRALDSVAKSILRLDSKISVGSIPQAVAISRTRVLEKAEPNGLWMRGEVLPAPSASLHYGAVGVAYTLGRLAFLSESDDFLTSARAWIDRALAETGSERAFADPEGKVAPRRVEDLSISFGQAGVHAVRALGALVTGKDHLESEAVDQFLRCGSGSSKPWDVTDGVAGYILASARLLRSEQQHASSKLLIDSARRHLRGLWRHLDREPPIGETMGPLGMAHGWAGFLYATLAWCRAEPAELPASLGHRLRELAGLAQPAGRGLVWPWRFPVAESGEEAFMAGWCNGSAGHVFLWTLAAEALGEEVFLELAVGAGWNAWESSQREGSLCCGLVGRAYALLRLYRSTGESPWLERARDLAELAATEGRFERRYPHSLFVGELGLALLAADLERPDTAVMPFFELEP